MTDGAQATIINAETVEKNLWEKLLPVERDGKKLTLDSKKLTVYIASLMTFITAIHLLIIPGEEKAEVPNGRLAEGSQTVQVPGASAADTKGIAETPAPKRPKLIGATVVLRPMDLSKIPPGSLLDAKLITGASNGLVKAEVLSPLKSAGELLIPSGTTLVGKGTSTEERLFVRFNQAVFKDGSIASINAHACDMSDKIVGLKGSRVGTKALNLTGSIGLGFLGGFSEALQDTKGQQGAVVKDPSLKNALLNGTASTALEQSKNLMSDLKDRTPIIEVPQGTDICTIFDQNQQ